MINDPTSILDIDVGGIVKNSLIDIIKNINQACFNNIYNKII